LAAQAPPPQASHAQSGSAQTPATEPAPEQTVRGFDSQPTAAPDIAPVGVPLADADLWATSTRVSTGAGAEVGFEVTVPAADGPGGIDWKPLLWQSAHMLAWQHGVRFAHEERTRRHVASVPTLKNWLTVLKSLDNWDDGGRTFTNYVAHPAQGATQAWLLVHNDPKGRQLVIGDDGYWTSRRKAFVFTTLSSVQFEIGPVSEAMLGLRPEREGWVDFVITPALGITWLIGEDFLDRHLVRKVERRGNDGLTRTVRTLLAPSRTFANMLRFRVPWHRDNRGMRQEWDERAREAGPGDSGGQGRD
jgi:hypothetical protein